LDVWEVERLRLKAKVERLPFDNSQGKKYKVAVKLSNFAKKTDFIFKKKNVRKIVSKLRLKREVGKFGRLKG
jgi:hypothetical protein